MSSLKGRVAIVFICLSKTHRYLIVFKLLTGEDQERKERNYNDVRMKGRMKSFKIYSFPNKIVYSFKLYII